MNEDEIIEIIKTEWANHMRLQTQIHEELQSIRDECVAMNDFLLEVEHGEKEA